MSLINFDDYLDKINKVLNENKLELLIIKTEISQDEIIIILDTGQIYKLTIR